MGLTLVTPATSDPITVFDLANEIVDYQADADNDTYLTSMIAAATEWVQDACWRQFMPATYLQTWDSFDRGRRLKFDIGPLISVSSVKYYDENDTLTTVAVTDYWVDSNSRIAQVVLKPTWSIPAISAGRPAAIQVQFVAGYATAALVPARAKQAIKLLAKYWYEKGEAATVDDNAEPDGAGGTFGEIPFGVFSICNQLNASGYV